MGGEIFKNSLRKLEAKSIQKFQRNISLETRQNSLSNDIKFLKNEVVLKDENLSQRPRKREINNLSTISDAFSRKIILDKSILADITYKLSNRIKETINSQKDTNWRKEQNLKSNSASLKTKIKDFKAKQTNTLIFSYKRFIIKDYIDFRLSKSISAVNNFANTSVNGFEFDTKLIIKTSISSFKSSYWINFKRLNLWTIINIVRKRNWPFDPGILILYNLFIVKMNTLFNNLNITFNCDWRTILISANSCRQWLAYFDEQYLENYWHAFHEDERIHIVESIANDYFNTFQHYDYKDAIIMFYINQNLDRVYYFDHTCINIEPYNLPESPDSNTVLKIRFDVIINDPIEFNRLFE